mmetsp:Transcript_10151/g.19482  ORF Transcript_10151/g.19482 Transcript_10151/m.19482 type:complete len:225 (+) Transcript_10151:236-910(+)
MFPCTCVPVASLISLAQSPPLSKDTTTSTMDNSFSLTNLAWNCAGFSIPLVDIMVLATHSALMATFVAIGPITRMTTFLLLSASNSLEILIASELTAVARLTRIGSDCESPSMLISVPSPSFADSTSNDTIVILSCFRSASLSMRIRRELTVVFRLNLLVAVAGGVPIMAIAFRATPTARIPMASNLQAPDSRRRPWRAPFNFLTSVCALTLRESLELVRVIPG